MALERIASATHSTSNPTTSLNITIPATTQTDDILILALVNRGATADPSVSDNDTGNSWAKLTNQNANTNGALTIWWKRATSATASKVISASGFTNSCAGGVMVVRGASTATNPFTDAATPVGEGNASGNETQAQITTLVADAMVFISIGNTGNNTNNATSYTATDPATLAEEFEATSSGGSDCSVFLAYAAKSTAGNTGSFNWSQTNGTGASIAFALAPLIPPPTVETRPFIAQKASGIEITSLAHQTYATTDLLLVAVGVHQGTLTGVTWDGVAMTELVDAATAFDETVDFYILENPGAVSGNIAIAGSGGSGYSIIAMNIVNCRTGNGYITAEATGSSSTSSVSITPTVANSLVIDAGYSEANATGFGTDQVQIADLQDESFENAYASYEYTSTGSQTQSASLSSGQRWAHVAIVIEPDLGETTDTTPTLSFLGVDPNDDDVRYNVQIADETFIEGSVIDSYAESNRNTFLAMHTDNTGTGQGQSFTGNGEKIGSAFFYLQKIGTPTGDIVAKLYSHSGTFGTSSLPDSLIETSDIIDISTIGSSDYELVAFIFSNTNTLTNGTNYCIVVEFAGSGWSNGVLVGVDNSSPAHSGNSFRKTTGSYSANSSIDTIFYVNTYETIPVVDSISGTDSGFSNITDGSDTDPFDSGDEMSFTVQAGDALSRGTYYWRVRAKDPAGTDTYGDWSTTQKIHIYEADREVSKALVSSVPTDSDHPYSSDAVAFTDTELTDTETDNATRVSLSGGEATKALFMQKYQIGASTGFYVDINAQVNLAAAGGDVTFDTATNNNGSATNTRTLAITVASNSDRCLIVTVHWNGSTTITGVTYNGDAMTQLGSTISNGTTYNCAVFYLYNPDTGSNNAVVTFSGAQTNVTTTASSYYNVNSVTQIDTSITSTGSIGTSATATNDLTTTKDGLIMVDAATINTSSGQSVSFGGSQTSIVNSANGGVTAAVSRKDAATAGTNSMSITNGSGVFSISNYARITLALRSSRISPSIKHDLYNFDTDSWENMTNRTSVSADTDFTDTIDKSASYADYVDVDGWLYVRTYADYLPSIIYRMDQFDVRAAGGAFSETYTETTILSDTLLRNIGKNLSELVAHTDTLIKTPSRLLLDTVVVSDTLLKSTLKLASETVVLTDTFLRSIGKVVTETIAHTDALLKQSSRTLLETVAHTDTFTALRTAFTTFTETVIPSDTITRVIGKVVSEAVIVTDTFLRSINKILTETVIHIDTVIRSMVRSFTESVHLLDIFDSLRLILKNLTETVIVSDVLLRAIGKVASEAVHLADTFLRASTRAFSETVTLIDTFLRSLSKTFTETANLADSVIKTAARTFTENTILSDTLDAIKATFKEFTESIVLSDIFTRVIGKVVTETVNLTDVFLRSVSKVFIQTVVISDVISAFKVTFKELTESVFLLDTLTRVIGKVLTETAALSDTLLRSIGKVLSDTLALADTFSRVISKIFTEIVTGFDIFIKSLSKSFIESVHLSDTVTFIKAVFLDIAETVHLTDSFARVNEIFKNLTETVNLTDTLNRIIGKVLTESVSLLDFILNNVNGKKWYSKIKDTFYSLTHNTWATKNSDSFAQKSSENWYDKNESNWEDH